MRFVLIILLQIMFYGGLLALLIEPQLATPMMIAALVLFMALRAGQI